MFMLNLLLFFLTTFLGKTGGAPDGQGAGDDAGGDAGGDANPGRTFTQAEVDRIAAERARRERDKFPDYDDLKTKAKAYDDAEDARKTQEQKDREAAEARDRQAASRESAADVRLIAADIKSRVAGLVHNPDHVVALLRNNPTIKVRGDEVEGVEDALKKLLEEHPYLKKAATPGGAGASGGDFGGPGTKTLAEQIAIAEAAGDWRLANRLKLQQARSGS